MDLPLLIGSLIVAALLFLALINIIKTAIKTAFFIAVVVFVLQILTGIGPEKVWEQVAKIIGAGWQWLQNIFADDKSNEAIIWLWQYLVG
jgi:hypothetical protein